MRTRMERAAMAATLVLMAIASPATGQHERSHESASNEAPTPIEIPLRVEGGRLMVTAEDVADGRYDFVLGLGMAILTESGAARIGDRRGALTLGGMPVRLDGAAEVPDDHLGGTDAVGVLGGETLNRFDILIDAPGGRLLLKPSSRAVRWDGIALSGPVPLQVFHDVLLRADVDFGGTLAGGLLELEKPTLVVNEPLGSAISDGSVGSFRLGYGSWSEVPAVESDDPALDRWGPPGSGFVLIGAPVAYDCVFAVSWYHAELRTCLR